jgi:hypothetical protein
MIGEDFFAETKKQALKIDPASATAHRQRLLSSG